MPEWGWTKIKGGYILRCSDCDGFGTENSFGAWHVRLILPMVEVFDDCTSLGVHTYITYQDADKVKEELLHMLTEE